jgi:3-dehydroquinate synthase
MPAGEQHKTREVKQQLEDELFKMKCGRDTCIIALGGGVVTDMAGFIAATFCRGVPVIYMPTSLLAMVDASIGGKTAVNTPHGKNLIGTFSQPKAVLIDPDILQSLPTREWHNGIAEIIKHALIADSAMFNSLQKNHHKFADQNVEFLNELIIRSCEIKKAVVEQDEKELGMRQLLNFGHTIGHAIEKIENYQIAHGEAVAIGIVVESYIAKLCGYLPEQDFQAICDIFPLYHLPMITNAFRDLEQFKQALVLDKKTVANTARFVLLDNIAHPHREGKLYSSSVTPDILDNALSWAQEKFNS